MKRSLLFLLGNDRLMRRLNKLSNLSERLFWILECVAVFSFYYFEIEHLSLVVEDTFSDYYIVVSSSELDSYIEFLLLFFLSSL